MALWGQQSCLGCVSTFLANQTPLACVTHSREWIPVSIQMAGRFVPPVLNWESREGRAWLCPCPTTFPSGSRSPNPHLEHVEGTVLGRAADLQLAHQVGVLGHQHVYETVNLGRRDVGVAASSPPALAARGAAGLCQEQTFPPEMPQILCLPTSSRVW